MFSLERLQTFTMLMIFPLYWMYLNILYYFNTEKYREKIIALRIKAQTAEIFNTEDNIGMFRTWQGLKITMLTIWCDATKHASLNGPAPNTKVISLDGWKHSRLLDFAKQGRPLVVNFGSCM